MNTMRAWFLSFTMIAVAAAAQAGPILVVKRADPMFDQAFQVVAEGLRSTHEVVAHDVVKKTSFEDFYSKVNSVKPEFMLLMDNGPVKHALTLSEKVGDPFAGLKAVASFALNLRKQLMGHATIAGIAYEVPALTIMTQFRFLIGQPLKNVLAIYRKSEFEATVQEAREQLSAENINLIALDAESKGKGKEAVEGFLEDNLQEIVHGTRIDAVWVITDNALINQATLAGIWLKRAKTFKVPFLCGVEPFVARSLDFCTFAAAPNTIDLAEQMVEMTQSILEDGIAPSDLGVKYLVSVVKILDIVKAERLGFVIAPERLGDLKIVR